MGYKHGNQAVSMSYKRHTKGMVRMKNKYHKMMLAETLILTAMMPLLHKLLSYWSDLVDQATLCYAWYSFDHSAFSLRLVWLTGLPTMKP